MNGIKMKLMELKEFFNRQNKNPMFKYGVPFCLFIVGGSFLLKEVTDIRYKYRTVKSVRKEVSLEGFKLKPTKEVTLEAQYEKIKEIDTSDWENKRIERPWEETENK